MTSAFEIVTFDCYGTLVDWETGIADAVIGAAAGDGVELSRRQVLEAHAEIEPAVQAEGFQSYHDVLVETAVRMAERFAWRLDPSRASFLPESLPAWHPFEDTGPALERLAGAGLALGILSNIDDRLLEGTLSRLPVSFELIVTAQQVRSYKPARVHFDVARERIGGRPWLHAAQSYFHDIAPASALGISTAWVNRKNDAASGAARPDIEVLNLAELADRLTS